MLVSAPCYFYFYFFCISCFFWSHIHRAIQARGVVCSTIQIKGISFFFLRRTTDSCNHPPYSQFSPVLPKFHSEHFIGEKGTGVCLWVSSFLMRAIGALLYLSYGTLTSSPAPLYTIFVTWGDVSVSIDEGSKEQSVCVRHTRHTINRNPCTKKNKGKKINASLV